MRTGKHVSGKGRTGHGPMLDWLAVLEKGEGTLTRGVDFPADSRPRSVQSGLHQQGNARGYLVYASVSGDVISYRAKPWEDSWRVKR